MHRSPGLVTGTTLGRSLQRHEMKEAAAHKKRPGADTPGQSSSRFAKQEPAALAWHSSSTVGSTGIATPLAGTPLTSQVLAGVSQAISLKVLNG